MKRWHVWVYKPKNFQTGPHSWRCLQNTQHFMRAYPYGCSFLLAFFTQCSLSNFTSCFFVESSSLMNPQQHVSTGKFSKADIRVVLSFSLSHALSASSKIASLPFRYRGFSSSLGFKIGSEQISSTPNTLRARCHLKSELSRLAKAENFWSGSSLSSSSFFSKGIVSKFHSPLETVRIVWWLYVHWALLDVRKEQGLPGASNMTENCTFRFVVGGRECNRIHSWPNFCRRTTITMYSVQSYVLRKWCRR